MIKLESFICETKFIAFLLLLSYFYLYLLVSFEHSLLEGVFLSSRQIVLSYLSFKSFFESQYLEVGSLYDFRFLTFYHVFIKHYINLHKQENKNNLDLFYGLNTLLFICFFRENRIIEKSIKNYQQECEILLSLLQNKEKQYEFTLEKNKLFTFKQKKPFFLGPFHRFFKKVRNFSKKIRKANKFITFYFILLTSKKEKKCKAKVNHYYNCLKMKTKIYKNIYQFFNRFYTLAKFFIKNLLYFTIKFDVLLIYAFSQTILFVFYVFAIVGGFCAGNKADLSTVYLFLFASYISASSFLLMIVCNTKSTMTWVERVCLLWKDLLRKRVRLTV